MSAVSPAPAPASARRDFAKEKERRQKKVLAVLSVLFLAVVGFQLPRLMGGSDTATAPAATGTLPTVPSETIPVAPDSQLPDTDRVVVEPQSGQLLSFGLFKSKDPFVQQVDPNALTPTTPTSTPSAPTSIPQTRPPTAVTPTAPQPQPQSPPRVAPVSFPPSTPVSTPPPAPVPTPTSTPSSPSSPTSPPAPTTQPSAPASDAPAMTPGTVAISTNGVCEIVALKGTFPGKEDIFRVVSIAKDRKSVKIGVVGGAYDGGTGTATLRRGEKLTLVNTADGTRYVVRLLAVCDVETEAAPPTTSTTATSTSTVPAPSSTAPAVDQPIVEDALDNGSAEDAASQGD